MKIFEIISEGGKVDTPVYVIGDSIANGIDSLGAVERMVKQFKTLNLEQQEAVTVFMDATKVDA